VTVLPIETPVEAPPETPGPALPWSFPWTQTHKAVHYSHEDANKAITDAIGYVYDVWQEPNLVISELYQWAQVFAPDWYSSVVRNDWNAYTKYLKDAGNSARVAVAATTIVIREFVERAIDSTYTDAMGAINHVAQVANHDVAVLQSQITGLRNVLNAKIGTETAQRIAQDKKLAAYTYTGLVNLQKSMQSWVKVNVVKPLTTHINNNYTATLKIISKTDTNNRIWTDAQIVAKLAPVVASVAALSKVVSALKTESDECTKPMCETMGPKTDLGKLLKGLNVAKWLAILAALEVIDVKELEHIAADVAGLEGKLGTFVGEHVLSELEAEHG
jgi:uncharacterized protein YoxC